LIFFHFFILEVYFIKISYIYDTSNVRRIKIIRVQVRDNNLEKALRAMKKKLQREGIFKEMKQRRAYEKPSEKKARQINESTRRFKKMLRKRIELQGY